MYLGEKGKICSELFEDWLSHEFLFVGVEVFLEVFAARKDKRGGCGIGSTPHLLRSEMTLDIERYRRYQMYLESWAKAE